MGKTDKTKEELIKEVEILRGRVTELEQLQNELGRAENNLLAYADRYHVFVDNNTAGIMNLEFQPPMPIDLPIEDQIERIANGVIVECNRQLASDYGFGSPDEMLGVKLKDLWGEDEQTAEVTIRQFIANGYGFPWEETYEQVKGGHYKTFLNSFSGEIKDNCLIRGWGTQIDITERKQAEEELRKNEEQYRLLVNNANQGILVVQNMLIKFCNPRLSEITGFSYEELSSKPFIEFVHPDDRQMVLEYHLKRFRGEQVPDFIQYRFYDGDNKLKWVETNAVIIDWEGGPAALGFISDITERKQAEQALKEKTEFLDKLIESSAVSMWISDENGTAIRANPACSEFFGAKEEEVIGKYNLFKDVVIEQQGFMPVIKDVFEKGEPASIIIDYDFAAVDHVDVKNATHKIINSVFTPVLDKDGVVSNVIIQTTDLTEIKQAEEALRKSERNLAQAQAIANIGSWEFHLETEELHWSDETYRIYGLEPGEREIDMAYIWETIHPDDKPHSAKAFEAIQKEGIPYDIEYRIILPDGSERLIHGIGKAERDAGGNIVRLYGTGQDITERKQAEKRLIKEKGFSETLIESMQEGFSVLDATGTHSNVNQALCKMTGFSKDELIGTKPPHPYWPPEEYEAINNAFQKTLGEKFGSFELTFMRKNGERFPVIVSPSEIKDESGSIISYFATVRDISERKQAEQSLLAAEQKYENLVERGNDGIIMIQGRLLKFLNQKMAQMTGYERDELIDKPFIEFVAPEYRKTVMDRYKQRMAGIDIPREYEIAILRKDGTEMPVEINASITEYEGAPADMAIVRDITQRKRLLMAMTASEKRQRAILTAVPDLMFIIKEDGTFTDYIPSPITKPFLPPQQFLGKKASQIMPQKLAAEFMMHIERTLAGSEIETIEYHFPTSDGMRYFEARLVAFGQGMVMSVCRDITDRKSAQKRIRESDARVTDLISTMHNAVFVYKAVDNGQDFVFTEFNSAAEIMEGSSREEVIGKRVTEISPMAKEVGLLAALQRVHKTGKAEHYPPSIYKGRRGNLDAWREVWLYRLSSKEVAAEYANVTEQKQAEGEIRDLNAAVEQSIGGVAMANTSKQITYVNAAYAHMHGYTVDEMTGMEIRQLNHPDYLKTANKHVKLIQKQGSAIYQTQHMRKDGTLFMLQEVFSTLLDESGAEKAYLLIAEDVSERLQAEEALVASEAKTRAILSAIPDMIFVVKKDGTFIDFVPSPYSVPFVAPQQFLGKKIGEVMPPQAAEMLLGIVKKAIKTGKVQQIDYPIPMPDGIRHYETRMVATDKDTVVAIARDITEQKQSEQEILRLNSAVAQASEGIVIVDERTRIVKYINSAYAKMLGYTVDEIIGIIPFRDFNNRIITPEYKDKTLDDVAQGSSSFAVEMEQIRRDGTVFPALLSVATLMEGEKELPEVIIVARDITDSKRREQEIRKLNNAVGQSIDGIAMSDMEPKLTFVNQAFARMHGYTVDEMIGMKVESIHSAQQQEEFKSRIGQIADQGSWTGEIGHMRKDGSTFPTFMTTTLLKDDQGVPTGIMVVTRDITEQKAAEEEAQRLREAIEQSIDGVAIIDSNRQVAFANKAFADLHGYTLDEIIGMTNDQLHAKEWRPQLTKNVTELRKKGSLVYEDVALRKDGTTVEVLKSATITDQGDNQRAILIMHDITKRKQAEEALRESEEKYRTILEETGEGMIATNAEGIIASVNRAAAIIMGYDSPEELVGKSMVEVYMYPESRAKILEELRSKDSISGVEITVKKKDGTPRDVLVHITTNKDDDGNIMNTVGLFSDITERKEAEAALKASEEKFRTISQGSVQGIVITKDQTIVYTNPAFEQLFGFTMDELNALSPQERIERTYADDRERVTKYHQDLFAGKDVAPNIEYRIVRKDGQVRWTDNRSTIIEYEGGAAVLSVCVDITERKQAEQAVADQRDKAQQYLDVAGTMFVAIDSEARVTLINQKGCQMLGYKESEIVGKNWFTTFLPKNLSKEVFGVFKRLIAGDIKPVEYYENPVLTRRGKERIIAWHNALLYDNDGNVVGTLSSGEDITERKEAEAKLREYSENLEHMVDDRTQDLKDSEEWHRMLLASANDAVYAYYRDEKGMQGSFIEANDAAVKMMGYSKKEFLNMNPIDLADPNNKQIDYAEITKRYNRDKHVTFESVHLTKDGRKIPVEVSSNLFPYKDKHISVNIVRDISGRKKAEEQLSAASERLSLASRSAKIGIWDWDVKNNHLIWDDRMYELYGIDRKDFSGAYEAWKQGVHPDDLERSDEEVQKALRGEQDFNTEFRVVWPNGSIHSIEAYADVYRDSNGEPIRMIGVNQDISDRKSLQEKLVRSEKLAVVGQLASGVAHEIRNPLAVINNAAYYLKLKMPDADEKITEYLDLLSNQVFRTSNIVEGLLDFARTREPRRVKFSINSVIKKALKYIRVPQKVEVVSDLAKDLPKVLGDGNQIERVVSNIITNAVQSIPESGQVTISTTKSDEYVKVVVSDTGSGIRVENMSKIFEPMFTTKERSGGIGIGLAISKTLVDQNNGIINVESQEGIGTTFTIKLPLA